MPTEVLDPVLGDPIDVSAAGRTLESIAVDVASIAARLRSLASSTEWTGTAAHSAYARSATVPPKLDKAQASYSAAGVALRTYARSLDEAQQQSESAIASANRASADLAAARGSQVAAANHDAVAVATAQAAGLPPPAPTAPRYQASIEDAAARLSRARALNDQAHDLQRRAAQVAAGALQQASHEGIRNESWMHRIAHSAGQWASTHWAAALHQVARVANTVSALAGLAALVLAVAGMLFPPREVAAGVLETVALASAVVAGMADTALAVTGRGSWKLVGIDVLGLAPAGLGKVVTKLAPVLRESRLIRPSTVVHASSGDARAGVVAGDAAFGSHPTWGNERRLPSHFDRHGADFGATSVDEYVSQAHTLLQEGLTGKHPIKLASDDGSIRIFDPLTDRFGAYNRDFTTKTFYRPDPAEHRFADNWEYWLAQKGEAPDGSRR